MEIKNLLALARECIINPNTQPLAEFNDVLEEHDIPRIDDKQYLWLVISNGERAIPYGIYSSLEASDKAVFSLWESYYDPDTSDLVMTHSAEYTQSVMGSDNVTCVDFSLCVYEDDSETDVLEHCTAYKLTINQLARIS